MFLKPILNNFLNHFKIANKLKAKSKCGKKFPKKKFFSKFDDFFHTKQNKYIMNDRMFLFFFSFFYISAKFSYIKKSIDPIEVFLTIRCFPTLHISFDLN
jgi:hypothetical protein